MSPYRLREHTGELQIRVDASTQAELFSEAARALAELMGGDTAVLPDVEQMVELEAPDRNALLVDWLNELIYLSERDKRLFRDVQIESISENALRARLLGHPVERLHLHVKAATFHGLNIEERAAGFTADIVLDV